MDPTKKNTNQILTTKFFNNPLIVPFKYDPFKIYIVHTSRCEYREVVFTLN